MNWTPEKLERFWKAAYPEAKINNYNAPWTRVESSGIMWQYPDQSYLETLLDMLKRLARGRGFTSVAVVLFVQPEGEHVQVLCARPGGESVNVVKDTEAAAVIAAICELIGLEEE